MKRRQFLQGSSLGVAAAAAGTLGAWVTAPASAAAAAHPGSGVPARAALPPHQRPLAEVRGKVAFITGGSSGIGLGMAQAFSEAGMKVIFTYMNETHRDEALQRFKPGNAGVHAIKLDVTDREAVRRAADEAEKVFGRVHLLCNNAGIGLRAPASEATYQDWDWGLGVNLGGVVNGIATFLPRMRAHGEGAHVMTTGSSASLVAGNVGVYVTSKYAVMGLMESLRDELNGQNIGVSIYCPGLVKSNIAASERNRPDSLRVEGMAAPAAESTPAMEEFMRRFAKVGMDPLEAGRLVLAGIRQNDLYILSHGEFRNVMRERAEALMASLPTAPAPPERAALTRTYTTAIYARERDWRLATRRLRRSG
jgi:NAD(P)-dependent dehydrogenase (short-subunit alcohol dehydrogenase family)